MSTGLALPGQLGPDFRLRRLRQLAVLGTGHTPDRAKPEYWEDCDIPWVTAADLSTRPNPYEPLMDTEQKISRLGLARSAAVLHPPCTVMLCRTASVGLICLIGVPMTTTQAFVTWTPGPNLDPRFLMYSLYAMAPEWDRLAYGSTHMSIYMPDIESLNVPHCALSTQTRIANFLDVETARIDALIAKKRRLGALLWERFACARRLAFYSEGSVRISWLPPISDEWPVQRLSRVATNLDGKRVPLNAEERSFIPGDYPYWGANGIVDAIGRYIFDEPLVLIGEDGAPFFEPDKDVAFSVSGKVWVNNHIHVLRPTSVLPGFLTEYLNTVDFGQLISGSTRDKLTQADLNGIPVPLPPPIVQEQIANRIALARRSCDAVAQKLDYQIELLSERRQALITAAVTGQIPIPA